MPRTSVGGSLCVLYIDTRPHTQNITMFSYSPSTLHTCSLILKELLSNPLKGSRAAHVRAVVNEFVPLVLTGRNFFKLQSVL